MNVKDVIINGNIKLSKMIIKYFEFLGVKNETNHKCINEKCCYYVGKDNNLICHAITECLIGNNILDMPFYIRGTIYTQEIFTKLGIKNDAKFDCSFDSYIYFIEDDDLGKMIGGIRVDTKIGDFIENTWFDATDILTEIFINEKPKSIEKFDKLYAKECYDLKNEAELLTKLLQISCIYNDNKYPDWSENTMKYGIKCHKGKLYIMSTRSVSSCIAFDKREYAEEYLKVFEKDLEKIKYWL